MRGAFRWSIDEDDLQAALTIFVALNGFWSAHSCPPDFLALVDAVLVEGRVGVGNELRAKALWVAGFQAVRRSDHDRAQRLLRQSVQPFRELGKGYETVRSLSELAIVEEERGLQTEATELAEEALAIAQELGDLGALSAASQALATIAYWRHDYAQSANLYHDALSIRRKAQDGPGPIASCLYNIGLCVRALEDWDLAENALREAYDVATHGGHSVIAGNAAAGLGYVALGRGDLELARSWLGRGLGVIAEIGNPEWTASALNLAAAITSAAGDARTSAHLWGTVDALRNPLWATAGDGLVRQRFEPVARKALGQPAFAAAAAEGKALPLADGVQLAQTVADSAGTSAAAPLG